MNKKIKRLIVEFFIFALLIIFDQYTKSLAVKYLLNKPSIKIIPNALELYYLPNGNTGAAFGILAGHQYLFSLIAIIVVLIIAYVLFNIPFDKKYNFVSCLLILIAAGGIGNMIDRLVQNYVVDFIYFSLINFPIFNVADIYVSVSTVLIMIYLIFIIKEEDYKKLEAAIKSPLKKKKK